MTLQRKHTLQVLADTGKIDLDRDVELVENPRLSNTREFENLRGLDDTGAEDDLLASINGEVAASSEKVDTSRRLFRA